ncbi:hypothetical protein CTI12_AA180910 [Artemisia annua]|uniref:N-acetyltransferase domain-containing protein n=1 Tax=Artemisia annua TaxID=35608 RepID=A0A2U1MQS5_ARTAN|nr:hypothetical protein CTI12_AA180910 [Artemisia annua]
MANPPELSIRPFELTDADDFLSWASDERVTKYLRWNTITNKQEAIKYLKERVIPHPWRRSLCWANKSIGYVSVKPESGPDHHRAHISYAISFDYWGRGIATAAVKMAIPMVFRELPYLVRLEALVEEENIGSQKVLAKVGFVTEGYLRKYGFNKGEIRDMIMYSFLSTDVLN